MVLSITKPCTSTYRGAPARIITQANLDEDAHLIPLERTLENTDPEHGSASSRVAGSLIPNEL